MPRVRRALGTARATAPATAHSEHVAALYTALERSDAEHAFDAFLALAPHDMTLAATEYRHLVQVLLEARPRSRDGMSRTLAVIEHAKSQRRKHSTRGMDHVCVEIEEVIGDAFVWNAVLSYAGAHGPHIGADGVAELLDLVAAGESARRMCEERRLLKTGGAQAPGERARFPDAVSYSIMLNAVVKSIPADASEHVKNRPRVRDHSLDALHHYVARGTYTPAKAEQLFHALWERMIEQGVARSAEIWCIRIGLYLRLRRLSHIHQCVQQMHREGLLTTVGVNAALWAYMRLKRKLSDGDCRALRAVYEAMRSNQSVSVDCTSPERGVAAPPAPASSIETVLGVSAIPAAVVPDQHTCALLVRVFAANGDLASALGVLRDMVEAPGADRAALDTRMRPSLDVYHALFAAFAKHGAASECLDGGSDAEPAWHTPETTRWNVHALTELFDGYLRVPPGAVRAPHAPAPAPSAAKLFWVLAALQRVGGSNPAWVLQQWARLESKFGAHDGAPSGGTWYGFALDTRLRQMLQQLETTASAMRRGARGDSTR